LQIVKINYGLELGKQLENFHFSFARQVKETCLFTARIYQWCNCLLVCPNLVNKSLMQYLKGANEFRLGKVKSGEGVW